MAIAFQELTQTDYSENQKGIRKHTRTWLATTTDPTHRGKEIVAGLGVSRFSAMPNDSLCYCKDIKASRTSSGDDVVTWMVVANYDNEPFDFGNSSASGSTPSPGTANSDTAPASRTWQIKWDSEEVKLPVVNDFSTPPKKVVNAAGIPFDPKPEFFFAHPTFTITAWKSFASFSYNTIAQFVGSVNSGTWLGFTGGTVLIKKYTAQTQYEQGAYWWQLDITGVVKTGDDKWNPTLIENIGTVEWTEADGWTRIEDDEGKYVDKAVPLNPDGSAADPAVDAVNYLEFNFYREEDFSSLI